jgi:catechol 2,3-dioxygenase-like lactoylglutathione lyase family enzyme
MGHNHERRRLILGSLAIPLAAAGFPRIGMTQVTTPASKLRRIQMATVAAHDLAAMESWYTEWLGYKVARRGQVSPGMAASWGAPDNADRPYMLLAPAAGGDVYIRGVEIDAVPGYRAMTTYGWNAIEIIIDDVYALRKQLEGAPFEIIGEPHSLGGGFASIHAMQVKGPCEEVLYLTCETGDREKSSLPLPKSFVDRPFIMVLAGPDLEAMGEFYVDKFAMGRIPNFSSSLGMVVDALGIDAAHQFPLGLLRAAERGNNIEIDEYPKAATVRPRHAGQLPPGVAMTTFSVVDLDELALDYIAPPAGHYGERRSATFVGPAGELTELIEEG